MGFKDKFSSILDVIEVSKKIGKQLWKPPKKP